MIKPATISIIYLALMAWIVAILPTACDIEYEFEHPTADQVLIDIKEENNG